MSVRPAQKVQLCPTPTGNYFVQDEVCLDDGAGNIREAMRFRTLDPATLATIGLRIVDTLTGNDATGTIVACPCDDEAGGSVGDLCAKLAALPLRGSNPVAASLLVGANCEKYSIAQLTATLATMLRGEPIQSLGGVTLGYLLPA